MTCRIPLTQGRFTIVDEADFDWLSQWNWHHSAGYARRSIRRWLPKVHMHRALLDSPAGLVVDHINGDTLDNRRCNLRACSRVQNSYNRGNSTGLKGASLIRATGQWKATITVSGKSRHLGLFATEEAAALAYDAAAAELFGEFARPNFPLQAQGLVDSPAEHAEAGEALDNVTFLPLKRRAP